MGRILAWGRLCSRPMSERMGSYSSMSVSLERCRFVGAASALVVGLSTLFPASAAAASPPAPQQQALRFEFHSSLLMNLHHFLFQRARSASALDTSGWAAQPNAAELQALAQAVAFYQAQYAQLDPLFDAPMAAIKLSLRKATDARQDASGLGLPEALAEQLNRVAPIYARCLWPQHDASNQTWITQARRLNERHGAAVQARLETQLAHAFTAQPLRTDLVFATGTRQGAYSGVQPEQIVMPSGRPDYQGDASLEMLYHEASHVGVTAPLYEGLDALLQQRLPSAGADQLWHALQFYTVGQAVQREFKQAGIDYQPYAERGQLYRRAGWAKWLPAIEQHWQPWLDGRVASMKQALQALVQALQQAPAP